MPIYIETGAYFTTTEAAEYLGRRTAYICQLVQNGAITGFRVGKMSYLIPASEVIERKRNPPPIGIPKSKPTG